MLEKMMRIIKIKILWNCLLFIDSSIEKKGTDNKTSIETAVQNVLKKKQLGRFDRDHNKNEDGSVNVEVDLRVGSHIG